MTFTFCCPEYTGGVVSYIYDLQYNPLNLPRECLALAVLLSQQSLLFCLIHLKSFMQVTKNNKQSMHRLSIKSNSPSTLKLCV